MNPSTDLAADTAERAADLDAKLARSLGPPSPGSDEFGDTAEAVQRRASWPDLSTASNEDLEAVVKLSGAPVWASAAWSLRAQGNLRMCEPRPGVRAFVLRSTCGRYGEARKLDGTPWKIPGDGYCDSWRFPGSLDTIPLGLDSLGAARAVAVAVPSRCYVATLAAVLEGNHFDCGVICFPSFSFRLVPSVVEVLAGRPVRFFAPVEMEARRAVAGWTAELEAAGCTVDAFDFARFGVFDANGFASLPDERKPAEVMPG